MTRAEEMARLKKRVKEMVRLGWAGWNWQWKRATARLAELEKERQCHAHTQ